MATKTTTDFNILENKITKAFSKYIFHPSVQSGKTPLADAIKKASPDKDPEYYISQIREVVESKLLATVDFYSTVQYRYMDTTGEWPEAGADRVKLSFLRLILKISADQDVSFSHYSQFEDEMNRRYIEYKINDLTKDQLWAILRDTPIVLLGKEFIENDSRNINRILELVGSPRRVVISIGSAGKSILVSVANSFQRDQYHIHYFYKEECRTPENVHYIVAMIEQQEVAIRQEVCEYVFYNKWLPVMESDIFQFEMMASSDVENISESIKKAVVCSFDVDTREAFLDKKDIFLSAMMENVLYHELAHDGIENDKMNMTELAITDGLANQKENILSILKEVMTEWMPEKNGVMGPLRHIVDTANLSGDKIKAMQMLLIYMSDGWFLDTDTTFMFSYNYIMFIILLKYIESPTEIDFITLSHDFNMIYDMLRKWYLDTTSDLIVMAKAITYEESGVSKTFEHLSDLIVGLVGLTNRIKGKTKTAEQKEGNFWINYFIQVKMKAPQVLDHMFEMLEKRASELYRILMAQFATKDDLVKFGDDVQGYIIYKMKQVGFDVQQLQE